MLWLHVVLHSDGPQELHFLWQLATGKWVLISTITSHVFQPDEVDQMRGRHWTSQVHRLARIDCLCATVNLPLNSCYQNIYLRVHSQTIKGAYRGHPKVLTRGGTNTILRRQ